MILQPPRRCFRPCKRRERRFLRVRARLPLAVPWWREREGGLDQAGGRVHRVQRGGARAGLGSAPARTRRSLISAGDRMRTSAIGEADPGSATPATGRGERRRSRRSGFAPFVPLVVNAPRRGEPNRILSPPSSAVYGPSSVVCRLSSGTTRALRAWRGARGAQLNDLPQPQVLSAFGFLISNPLPCSPSSKSTFDPSR